MATPECASKATLTTTVLRTYLLSGFIVDLFVIPTKTIHHLPLFLHKHTCDQLPFRHAVMARKALELRLGLDCNDHVDAGALSVDIQKMPLPISGLPLGVARDGCPGSSSGHDMLVDCYAVTRYLTQGCSAEGEAPDLVEPTASSRARFITQ